MKKRMMSMILAGSMAAMMLSGCGSTATEENTAASANEQGGSTAESTAAAEESSSAATSTEAQEDTDSALTEEDSTTSRLVNEDGSITDIEMYGLGFFGENGLSEVMERVNAISEAKIGVHVNYHIMDISTYMQQIPLMLTSNGEQVDLIMDTSIPTTSFVTFSAQGQLMDITDYVEDYAPETKELMSKYLPCTTVNGKLYGIPCYRSYNSSYYAVMRKDILDELGLTEEAENIKSWTDYKNILVKVKEAQDQLPQEMRTNSMICNSDTQGSVITGGYIDTAADNFADNYGFDSLGDSNRIVKVNDDGTVENFFADEDYRTMVERIKDWYDSGLVYKDAATAQEGADQQIANGVAFSCCVQSEIGVEESRRIATGYDVVCVPIVSIPVQSSNANSWAWSVPYVSEEPEAAVAFLNLMYTDPEIENLFVYGIEGRDYELNDQQEAVILDTKEYQNSEFLFGNQFIAYPAEGAGTNFRQEALDSLNNAELSPYFGMVVDTDPVANEQTALNAVLKKYEASLESGTADPSLIDTMNAELENAGLQKYLDYFQEQLDAWEK